MILPGREPVLARKPLWLPNRFSPGCNCCCSGPVLLWDDNCHSGFGGQLDETQDVYEAAGHVADYTADWSGTLDDYKLIIWTMAESNPSWWSEITGATWKGRILITAEFWYYSATVSYVNGLSGTTGISVNGVNPDRNSGTYQCTPQTHALTKGQSTIATARTALTSGGTNLCDTCDSGSATSWIMENTVGDISFVVSGDSSPFSDHAPGYAAHNSTFLLNLLCVPV